MSDIKVEKAAGLLSRYSSLSTIADVLKGLSADQASEVFKRVPGLWERYIESARAAAGRSY